MHLDALVVVAVVRGNFDAVRACCPAFSRTLAPVSVLCKERLEAVPALAGQVLSCLVIIIYTHIAITLIVIGKGPALVVVAVFRTSHISHTFESGRCTS